MGVIGECVSGSVCEGGEHLGVGLGGDLLVVCESFGLFAYVFTCGRGGEGGGSGKGGKKGKGREGEQLKEGRVQE